MTRSTNVDFLVSLEVRMSPVTRRADVVLPVAPVAEKAGHVRRLGGPHPDVRDGPHHGRDVRRSGARRARRASSTSNSAAPTWSTIRREIGGTPPTEAPRPAAPSVRGHRRRSSPRTRRSSPRWHHLIDLGSLTDGDEDLAGTARPSVVRIGKALARQLGVADGDPVTVGTERGTVTLPAAVTEMPDGVVWLPTNSPSSTVRRTLGVTSGGVVSVAAGGATSAGTGSADTADATSRGGNL